MKKKLYTSTKNKKLAGVCAGIAEYLGIDATVLRLIVAVGTLFWGTGLWIYLVCALVLPKDTELTESDKEIPEKTEEKTEEKSGEGAEKQ